MDATVWPGTGKKQPGIRVGATNRARFFSTSWKQVLVEMDGELRHFNLSPGFWKDWPEFRDGPRGIHQSLARQAWAARMAQRPSAACRSRALRRQPFSITQALGKLCR
jgi:hypothetical protein